MRANEISEILGRPVRSHYDGMVRIVMTPTWAKLIDFETTPPARSRIWSGSEPSVSTPLTTARPY